MIYKFYLYIFIFLRLSIQENENESILICAYSHPTHSVLFIEGVIFYNYFKSYIDYNLDIICSNMNGIVHIDGNKNSFPLEKESIFFYNLYNLILSHMKNRLADENLINFLQTTLNINKFKIYDKFLNISVKKYFCEFNKIFEQNRMKIRPNNIKFLKTKEKFYESIYFVIKLVLKTEDETYITKMVEFLMIYFFEIKRKKRYDMDSVFKKKYRDHKYVNFSRICMLNSLSNNVIYQYINLTVKEKPKQIEKIFINIYLNFTLYVFTAIASNINFFMSIKKHTINILFKLIEDMFINDKENSKNQFSECNELLDQFLLTIKDFNYLIVVKIKNSFSKKYLLQLLDSYLYLSHRIFSTLEFSKCIDKIEAKIDIIYKEKIDFFKKISNEKVIFTSDYDDDNFFDTENLQSRERDEKYNEKTNFQNIEQFKHKNMLVFDQKYKKYYIDYNFVSSKNQYPLDNSHMHVIIENDETI